MNKEKMIDNGEVIEKLEMYGYKLDRDYYIEEILLVDVDSTISQRVEIPRSKYERGEISHYLGKQTIRDRRLEYDEVCGTKYYEVRYTDSDERVETDTIKPMYMPNRCPICNIPLKPTGFDDIRIKNGLIYCSEHIDNPLSMKEAKKLRISDYSMNIPEFNHKNETGFFDNDKFAQVKWGGL